MLIAVAAVMISPVYQAIDPVVVTKKLKLVREFLEGAQEITTLVSDRILERDPLVGKARAKLFAGKTLTTGEKTQTKTSRIAVLTASQRKLALNYFDDLTQTPNHERADCFMPRHMVFARKSSQWVGISICYECEAVLIQSSEKKLEVVIGVNRNSRNHADRFFGYTSKNSRA